MRLKNTITLILILIFQMTHIHANESISIGYSAKYDNFEYFDYVNPYSKKGGHIVISAFGTNLKSAGCLELPVRWYLNQQIKVSDKI